MTKAKLAGMGLATLFVALSATAEAKLYKWVDDQGETHYGEVVPPEYANKDKVQINEKGREVKKKEADSATASGKKTPEEQAAIDQRRRDKALVNTYSNEKEIDLARARNLQQVEARINSVQLMLKSAQQNLADYQKEISGLQKAGRKIPASLQADVTEEENKVAKLKQELAAAEEKAATVKANFEADKIRYRELTGGAKK